MDTNRAQRIRALSREQLVVLGYAKQGRRGASLDLRCFVSVRYGSGENWITAVIAYKRHPREDFAATPVRIEILEHELGQDPVEFDECLVEGYLKALHWDNSQVQPLMFQCETADEESVYVGWSAADPSLLQIWATLEEALRYYILLECKNANSSGPVALKKSLAICAISQLTAIRRRANEAAHIRTRPI